MKRASKKYIWYLSIFITAISFLVLLISNYVAYLLEPAFSLRILIFAAFAVVLGAILTIGVSVFNPVLAEAMSTLRLMLRIDNLSNPLITRLSSEAPGTYHHSLNVSTLAQKAARSIKANNLLVRTAAYYHDIGKIENPKLFTENQLEKDIPLEDSALITKNAKDIISHVKDGIRIAKLYHLPEEIIDLIAEHHGTTKASYFYGKAKEKGLKIKVTDFKYPGPSPQSKESAILMLADCIEAAAKSTPNITAKEIDQTVDKIFNDRINENQLKNSNLSNKEVTLLKQSFKESLRSIYHQRIEYNDDKNKSRK